MMCVVLMVVVLVVVLVIDIYIYPTPLILIIVRKIKNEWSETKNFPSNTMSSTSKIPKDSEKNPTYNHI